MNNQTLNANPFREQLSALMDGELGGDSVRFLLRGIDVEPDLLRRWSNYQVISATLKHEYLALQLPADFANRVLDRLEVPATVTVPVARRGVGALRWVGGGAIAAAVAVAALVVTRPPAGQGGALAPAVSGVTVAQRANASPAQTPMPASLTANPLPLPGGNFNPNYVQPASYDSFIPNYYNPQGGIYSPTSNVSALQPPYVLYVAPPYRKPQSPATPSSASPASAQ